MSIPRPSGAAGVYGIIGDPVSQSLSPAMHNAAFRELGLDAVLVPFPIAPRALPAAIAGLAAAGVRGFSVTTPHKLPLLPLLDEVQPEARAIGAVNCVRIDGGRLTGTNYDGVGFVRSLQHDLGVEPPGREVLLLGAGGAARAIAFALLGARVEQLTIANRTTARAEALVAECRTRFPGRRVVALPLDAVSGARRHVLVNSTTVGMGADARVPVELAAVGVREAVAEIIYHPPVTPLMLAARALGLRTTNGVGMLLYQDMAAFQYWTGREAPVAVMRQALYDGLEAGG